MPTYLTTDDLRNFGPEVLDLAQRASLHAVAPHLQEISEENSELRARVARQEQQDLHRRVAEAIPDWRAVNSDPRWLQWLAQPDMLNGVSRQRLMNDAVARGDARAVVAIFQDFLREAGASQAPGRVRDAVPAGGRYEAPSGRIFTRADITRAHRDFMRGRYRGREAEYERLQREFLRASAEGRVTGALPIGTK